MTSREAWLQWTLCRYHVEAEHVVTFHRLLLYPVGLIHSGHLLLRTTKSW